MLIGLWELLHCQYKIPYYILFLPLSNCARMSLETVLLYTTASRRRTNRSTSRVLNWTSPEEWRRLVMKQTAWRIVSTSSRTTSMTKKWTHWTPWRSCKSISSNSNPRRSCWRSWSRWRRRVWGAVMTWWWSRRRGRKFRYASLCQENLIRTVSRIPFREIFTLDWKWLYKRYKGS